MDAGLYDDFKCFVEYEHKRQRPATCGGKIFLNWSAPCQLRNFIICEYQSKKVNLVCRTEQEADMYNIFLYSVVTLYSQ